MQRFNSLALIAVIFVLMAFTVQVSKQPATAINNITNTGTPTKATTFVVDNQHSKLTWTARKVTGEHSGNITINGGTLQVENNALKSGNFTLDTRTITNTDITDPETRGKLLTHLKSDDFFAVDKFPAADFVITAVTAKGGGNYDVAGKLTIKGITNNITFPATIAVANNKLSAKARIKVDRTKYDIKFRSKRFFENLGDKVIYDDFDLDVVLVASAQ
jgi:polyisoprenoid-binding protein YceI